MTLSSMLSRMSNDVITLVKPDGTIVEKIKANVQPNKIFIYDETLPLEENDKLYRPLPNGLVEIYLVIDRGFYSALHSIPAHYQAKVRKESLIKEDQYKQITNVFNLNGPQSKVNINSIDNSMNITQKTDELFDSIIRSLNQIENEIERDKAIQVTNELKKEVGKSNFIEKYKNFITVLANHITIIAPFLSAITALLPK